MMYTEVNMNAIVERGFQNYKKDESSNDEFQLSDDYAVQHFLLPYKKFMDDSEVTELAVNDEGRFWVLKNSKWTMHNSPNTTDDKLISLGTTVAQFAKGTFDRNTPILSASMPDGSRMQIVQSPAVESRRTSFTMRRPSTKTYLLDDFEQQGMFRRTVVAKNEMKPHEQALIKLLKESDYKNFIKQAVINKLNIVCCGATGSGKTTFMKGIVHEIPLHERIITIEDVRELFLPHQNAVHLVYPGIKNKNGELIVTTQDLLKSCLRMKPDRILLAELRSQECLYYIRSAASGHPGSITSCHAGSAAEAFEQMTIMIKESDAGANLEYQIIKRLLQLTVDVIIQFDVDNEGRYIKEIYYKPELKYELA